jgi:hypothetical protein
LPHLFRQDLKAGNTDAVKADRADIQKDLFLQLRSTGRQRHVDVKRPTMIDDDGRT